VKNRETWLCEHCLQVTSRMVKGVKARFCDEDCEKCEYDSEGDEGCDGICKKSTKGEESV